MKRKTVRVQERQVGRYLFEIEEYHKKRYEWAFKYIEGSVLDCACGVGYGSKILSEKAGTKVLGVDKDLETINFARKWYNAINIQYIVQDMTRLCFDINFDTIVSLESLEHVEDPVDVLKLFKKNLKSDGKLIVSLPTVPTVRCNIFHKFEIKSVAEGVELFEKNGFELLEFHHQIKDRIRKYGLFLLRKND